MFLATLREFTGNTFLSKFNNHIYYESKFSLYDQGLNELIDLQIDEVNSLSPLIGDKGVWLGDYYKNISYLYDLNKNEIVSIKPYFVSSHDIRINEYYYHVQSYDDRGLEKYDENDQLISKVKGCYYGHFSCSNKYLYLYKGGDVSSVCAYDLNLSLVWEVCSEKQCFSGASKQPYYYPNKNLVIVNLGEEPVQPRGNFEINAYHGDTGELVWQQIVATSPDISKLYGDKIYAVVREHILILDAATGEILHKVNHGLFEPSSEMLTHTFVHPYTANNQDCLLVTSAYHHCVQLRPADAQHILQTIKVPMPFTTSHHEPVCCDGKVYIGLANADSGGNMIRGAVLVLTELGGDSAAEALEAEIEPRPPISVMLETNETGEQVYVVSIAHDNLSDVIRYGTIALKETAYKYGGFRGSTERNKSHAGSLCLKVKAEPLGMGENELLGALSVIKRRVESSLNLMPKKAGNKKSDFSVSIVLV